MTHDDGACAQQEPAKPGDPVREEDTAPSHAVVFDMDGTLIPKHEALFARVSRAAVNPAGMEKLRKMHAHYGPGNLAGTLTTDQEREWLRESMQTFIDSGLTVHDVRKALTGLAFRPGVKECLEWLRQKNIPVAIVSYGIRSFIKIALEQAGIEYGMHVWTIFAARFDIDLKSGRYIGIDPASFVLPSDKGRCSERFADWMQVPHSRIIGAGDTGGDRFLGRLKENRCAVAQSEEESRIIAPHFGQVFVTESFHPTFDWIRSKIEPSLP